MPRLGAPRSTTAAFRRAKRPRAQVDAANVLPRVVLKVDGLDRAEVERLLTAGGAPDADDVSAELTCELRHHLTD